MLKKQELQKQLQLKTQQLEETSKTWSRTRRDNVMSDINSAISRKTRKSS